MKIVKNILPYLFLVVISINVLSVSSANKKAKKNVSRKIRKEGEVKKKEGERCSTFGIVKDICEDGLICTKQKFGVYKCVRQNESGVFAKSGEVCSQPIPNFEEKKCQSGFECRLEDSKINSGIKGASKVCLSVESRPITVKIGESCHEFTEVVSPRHICPERSECINKVCKSSGLQKSEEVRLATPGQVCYQSTPGFKKVKCPEGYECRLRDKHINSHMMGVASVCLSIATKPIFVKTGESCHLVENSEVPNRLCPDGELCHNGICSNLIIKRHKKKFY